MACPHDITERDVAVSADGYCPLCQAVELERLRMAIRWALGEAADDDGKWFAEDRNDRPAGQGRRYWWRSHLRKLAALEI